MKYTIIAFLLTISFYNATTQVPEVPELTKFVGKNWRVSDVDLGYCQFFYYGILAETDRNGLIQGWKYINEVPTPVKKNLDHLKKFRFPDKYGLRNSTILFYITVDQSDICPNATAHIQQSTEVMTEVLEDIAAEVEDNPQIRVIYRPIGMRYYKPSH